MNPIIFWFTRWPWTT